MYSDFPQMFNTSAGQSFDRLYGRAIRGACCINNCFLEGQFVSNVFFLHESFRIVQNCSPVSL